MGLKETITEDMKNALRAKDTERLGAIRLLLAAVQRREVDERTTLDDAAVMAVAEKLIKQSREAATQFEQGGRADLVDKENREIAVWQAYLPEPLDDQALDKMVRDALAETSAETMRDMGKVMGVLKPKLQGRADMARVSKMVKTLLGG
ncbi:MAG: GatB/YqeY domain-containing protein [Acidiferrobacterales bacterium]